MKKQTQNHSQQNLLRKKSSTMSDTPSEDMKSCEVGCQESKMLPADSPKGQTREEELEKEIKILGKIKNPTALDFNYYDKLNSELKGIKQGKLERLENELDWLMGFGINFKKEYDKVEYINTRIGKVKQEIAKERK